MAFLVICFLVGVAFLMLFSSEGRGCLGGLIGIVFLLIVITAIGAAVLGGGLFALIKLLG